MKPNSTKPIFFIIIVILLSCSKENYNTEYFRQKGILAVSCNFDYISIDESFLKASRGLKELKLKIINAINNNVEAVYIIVDQFLDSIFLIPGKYYVEVESNKIFSAAFDNPYFYGKSPIFEVKPQTYNHIEIICKIVNCAISIEYSDNVKNQFSNYYCELSNQDTFIIYDKNETRKAYFLLKPIDIKVNLVYNENGIEKYKSIESRISSPEAGKHYKLFINANLNSTVAGFNVGIDSTLTDESIFLSDSINVNPYYKKILITEIMYDPDSIDDSKGEWFEIYNNSDEVLNLKNLVIKTGTRFHQINCDLYIAPESYHLFEKSENATPYLGYIYGSSLSFNNTGYVKIEIATFGTNGLDGDVISAIHYGTGTTMPKATGASLNLNLDCYSFDSLLNSDCWCVSDSLYDGKNKGTPGYINKLCY